jgi:hypothetical protein
MGAATPKSVIRRVGVICGTLQQCAAFAQSPPQMA